MPRLEKLGLSTRKVGNKEMGDTKLLIEDGASMVKIEVNTVLRGAVLPVERRLTDSQKGFVVSLLRAEPDWSLLACLHASELPGLKWKLENLLKFREQKPDTFEEQACLLEKLLGR